MPMAMGSRSLRFQQTRCDVVLQRHTIQKFLHDERLAIVLPNLVDGAEVGVVQSQKPHEPRGGNVPLPAGLGLGHQEET